MIASFNYVRFPPASKEPKLRPMLKVYFKSHINTLPAFDALVDSGSDITLSYEEIGRKLGIDFDDEGFRKKTELQTGLPFNDKVSGLAPKPVDVFVVPVELSINGKTMKVCVRWIKENFNSETDFPIMLGQDSVFWLFDIHFSKRQHKFFLSEEVFQPKPD